LLRALATVGVFQELENERFAPTELSDALRTDAPKSVAGWAAFIGSPAYWQGWSALVHSVRTGESGFEAVHGQNVWDVAFSDLNMLVGPGGQERTETEYAALLNAAGFHLGRIVPTDSDVSVLEALPR
jgi:O-methyltransferase